MCQQNWSSYPQYWNFCRTQNHRFCTARDEICQGVIPFAPMLSCKETLEKRYTENICPKSLGALSAKVAGMKKTKLFTARSFKVMIRILTAVEAFNMVSAIPDTSMGQDQVMKTCTQRRGVQKRHQCQNLRTQNKYSLYFVTKICNQDDSLTDI